MDPYQFDKYVVFPALNITSLFSQSARVLMLGTGLFESNLEFLEQIGEANALGVYQIEASTYLDIIRYLSRNDNKKLRQRCLAACFYECCPSSDALIHNLRWATIVARLKYFMSPDELPPQDDAVLLSKYYKKIYNTSFGKAEEEKIIPVFEHAIKIINN